MKVEDPTKIKFCLDKFDGYSVPSTVTSRLDKGGVIHAKINSSYTIDDPLIYEDLPSCGDDKNNISPEVLMEDIEDHFGLDLIKGGKIQMDEIDETIASYFRIYGDVIQSFFDPYLYEENMLFSHLFNAGLGTCLESSIVFQLASQDERDTYTVHSITNNGFPHSFNIIESEDSELYIMDVNNSLNSGERERIRELGLETGKLMTTYEDDYRPFLINNYGRILEHMNKEENMDELKEVLNVKKQLQ